MTHRLIIAQVVSYIGSMLAKLCFVLKNRMLSPREKSPVGKIFSQDPFGSWYMDASVSTLCHTVNLGASYVY
jgi:hypothetical protein